MEKETILGILFPRRCPVCGEVVKPAGAKICPPCFQKLSLIQAPVCKKCGKEVSSETVELCEDCMARRHAFESGMGLFHYNEAARHSMAQIKYNNKREYLDFYSAAAAARYGEQLRRLAVDAIVPVPVHASRRRARGFNQAEVFGRLLGKRLGIPVCPGLLERSRRTKPQKNLSAAERLQNLSGAFTAGKAMPGVKTVLLTDDIYTTGSTIEACARALRAAGVERVYFLVICMAGG